MERIRTVRVLSIFSLAFLLLAVGCKKKPDADHPVTDSVRTKATTAASTGLGNTWKWVNGQIKYTVLPGSSAKVSIYERGSWAESVTVAGSITDTIENCRTRGSKDLIITTGIYLFTPKYYPGACPAVPDSIFAAPTSADTIPGGYIIRFRGADSNNVSIDISLLDIPTGTNDNP